MVMSVPRAVWMISSSSSGITGMSADYTEKHTSLGFSCSALLTYIGNIQLHFNK